MAAKKKTRPAFRLSIWSAAIAILLVVMILALLGFIQLKVTDLFWVVITIGCLWLISRVFFPKR